MVTRVNTGVPVPGGALNAPGAERQKQNTLFSALSTSELSHRISVDESPVYIKAFGLANLETVEVMMVTDTDTGEVQDAMSVNGRPVALYNFGNFIVLDIPGIYRLLLSSSGLGRVIVVMGYTSLSYDSWGLKAYGCCEAPALATLISEAGGG